MPYILPWKKSEMILALAGARLSPGLLPYHHPPVKAAPTDRVDVYKRQIYKNETCNYIIKAYNYSL